MGFRFFKYIWMFLILGLGASWAGAPANPWRDVKKPTQSQPEVIGSYSAGCLRGAQELPTDANGVGNGYQTMRPSRHRVFAHPTLIEFLQWLGRTAYTQGLGVTLIGDLGQPRGGPTLSGHVSHQSGLDADIWFWQPPENRVLTQAERENISAPLMVVPEFGRLTSHWKPQNAEILKLAAQAQEVERIFVNPSIKKALCTLYPREPWLQKLRPWWFHDDHFHLRLRCPVNGPVPALCQAQEPVPPGDGCDSSLEVWFTPYMKKKAHYMRTHPEPASTLLPKLPAECSKVLVEP